MCHNLAVSRWQKGNRESANRNHRAWVQLNRERARQHTRAYKDRNREKIRQRGVQYWKERGPAFRRNSKLKYIYNIGLAEQEAMLAAQNESCAICERPLVGDSKINKPHIDHCHETGKLRGVLCMVCNSGLGMFQDNPTLLRQAVIYLEHYAKDHAAT